MANTFIFANNASTTLAAPITNAATSLTVSSGTGAEFPTPSAGQQFAAVGRRPESSRNEKATAAAATAVISRD